MGQTEKHTNEEPQVRVQNKVLIRLHSLKRERQEQQECVEENHEGERKPRRAAKLANDFPGGNQYAGAHNEPHHQAQNAKLEDKAAKAALHGFGGSRDLKDARDVLTAERGGADSEAVGPARAVKSADEIGQRIVSRAMN